jgi:uncharacterized membrane protein YhhN
MDLALSMLLSGVYFFTIPWHPFPASWLIKAGSVAILARLASRRRAFGLALGLGFSALGDALLEYSPGLFAAGLAAFLSAHITYTGIFVRSWQAARIGIGAIALIAYSASLAAWLVPAAGVLAIPVAIYVTAITAMAASAITARFPSPWVATGALLFVLSDSVLAVNRFRMPVPFEAWIVWSTYYAAQLLITRGYLSALVNAPARDIPTRSAAAG